MISRTLVGVSAGLAVVSVMVTANLWREVHAERDVTGGLRTELAESKARTQFAGAAASQATSIATVPARPQLEPDAPPATTTSSVPSGVIDTGSSRSEQELLTDLEFRRPSLAMLRASIIQTYPGLAEELGLTADEADRMFGLMAETQMALTSQSTIILTGDEQADRAAVAQMNQSREALQRQQGKSIRELLGEARYVQWQAYQPSRSARMQASTYARALAQAGSPLNSPQLNTLVSALLEEQRSLQRDTVALGRTVDPSNPHSQQQARDALRIRQVESSQRILDAASTSLNAQQLVLLRAQFEQEDAVNVATQRLRERPGAVRLQR